MTLAFLFVVGAGAAGQPAETPDPEPQRPGHFILRNNIALGEYAGFTYNGGDGTVSLFSVAGAVFFDQITTPGPFTATADGGVVTLTGEDFNVTFHDNPMAPIRFQSSQKTFLLEPSATDADTSFQPGAIFNVGRVDIQVGDRHGFITNAQPPRHWGITAQDGSLFKLAAASVADLAHPSPFQDQVDVAIQDGRVAAQYQVFATGSDALVYEDVDVRFAEMENGSYRFLVDGHVEGGRAFVVNFAPGVFPAENLNVLYYNETFEALMPADIWQSASLDDVLDPQGDPTAEYLWVVDPSGTHVIVSIPSFSVHAFDVMGIPPEVVPLIAYGVVAGILFAALAGAGLVLGARRR